MPPQLAVPAALRARIVPLVTALVASAGVIAMSPSPAQAASGFAAGDLVVYRVGDGSATLGSGATAVFLDEYTPSGSMAQSVPLPTAVSGSNKRLTASGTASSEGLLSLSGDGRYLVATGYNAATGTSSVASSSSSSVSRTAGIVDAAGTVDTTTSLTDAFTGNNVRSAASQNGSAVVVTGAAASGQPGARSAARGASTSTGLVPGTVSNLRASGVFNGQLYVSASTSIAAVGSGVPTSGTNAVTPLTFDVAPTNAYGFAFLSLAATGGPSDTLYVADGTAGIVKYSLGANGTWTKKGTVALSGVTGVTANDVNGVAQIYASGPTGVYSLSDASGQTGNLTGSATKIASAAGNTAIRGIAFAPGTVIGSGPGTPPVVPTIAVAHSGLPAALGDPTNASDQVVVADDAYAANRLTVTASSSNQAVAADGGISLSGSGGTRTLSVTPAGAVGTATITLTVTAPDGQAATTTVSYAVSADQGSASDRYYSGVGNASAAIDVGSGYMVVGDDESDVLGLYDQTRSGPPVATFDFTSKLPFGTAEVDIEGAARVGDTIYWTGSMSNNSKGQVAPARSTVFATTVSGSGATTTLSYVGAYTGLQSDMVGWDKRDGHGLGADYLGFDASVNNGTGNHTPSSFNVEGLEFSATAPNTAYFTFRGPLEPTSNRHLALVVPVTNLPALIRGGASSATFGAPLFWDLGGLGIRDIRGNADGDYLVLAGTAGETNDSFVLYTWDGDPADPPLAGQTLPLVPGGGQQGSWEAVVATPDPLSAAADVRLLEDNGTTAWYGDGNTSKSGLQADLQKDLGRVVAYTAPTQLATSTRLTTSAANASVGDQVTYTATVSAASGSPRGTVAFSDDDGTGAAVVDGCEARPVAADGTATCTVSYPTAGTHQVSAAYSGSKAYAGSTSNTVTETVALIATSTALTTSDAEVSAGDAATYTATVSAASGSPRGTVSFSDDDGSGAAVLDGCDAQPVAADGTATCTVTYPTAGTHQVTAAYSGSRAHAASTSNTVTETVDLIATTTTLTTSDARVSVGDQVTYTATVSAASGSPRGTVSFSDDDGSGAAVLDGCDAQPVAADGTATCTVTYPTAGTHQVTAAYSGSRAHAASTSNTVTETVDLIATTTTLTTSDARVSVGDQVTYTATVSAASGSPRGTVSFTDDDGSGAATVDGCEARPVDADGIATCTVTYQHAGSHQIGATYSGSRIHGASASDPLTETVNPVATTTTLATDNADLVTGQAVTFTATMAPSGATGSVTFSADGTRLAGCRAVPVDDSGRAQCSVPGGFQPSTPTITAAYSGDGDHRPSTSDDLTENVVRADTLTTVTADPDQPQAGQDLVFTARVTPVAPGVGTPTGSATFTVTGPRGAVDCAGGDAVTVSNGQATCTIPGSRVRGGGEYDASVAYSGDGGFNASTGSVDRTAARTGSSTTVTSSRNPSASGQAVSLTATVAAIGSVSDVPTGTVTFSITGQSGATVACQVRNTVALRGGIARCLLPRGTLTAGDAPYAVQVVYSGDSQFEPSDATFQQRVTKATARLTLTQSSSKSPAGQPVTFTAKVASPAGGPLMPTGPISITVTDRSGKTVTCDPGPPQPGEQSCTVPRGALTRAGSPYTVIATYAGDDAFNGASRRILHGVTT